MMQHQRRTHPSLERTREPPHGSHFDSHTFTPNQAEGASLEHEIPRDTSSDVLNSLLPENAKFQTTASVSCQLSFIPEQEEPGAATMVVNQYQGLQVPWQQRDGFEAALLVSNEPNTSPSNPTAQSASLRESYHHQQLSQMVQPGIYQRQPFHTFPQTYIYQEQPINHYSTPQPFYQTTATSAAYQTQPQRWHYGVPYWPSAERITVDQLPSWGSEFFDA
ncbi:hypothetical protein F5Y16DRAFT_104276 [Xylariaceae sp. FL0255]|nr:hypothetical protein F5Y16DRAFT_104276 [Xylariaceae sp. FL0255]